MKFLIVILCVNSIIMSNCAAASIRYLKPAISQVAVRSLVTNLTPRNRLILPAFKPTQNLQQAVCAAQHMCLVIKEYPIMQAEYNYPKTDAESMALLKNVSAFYPLVKKPIAQALNDLYTIYELGDLQKHDLAYKLPAEPENSKIYRDREPYKSHPEEFALYMVLRDLSSRASKNGWVIKKAVNIRLSSR